jgi:hypothetical protein
MQATVIVQVHWRPSEIFRQRRRMIATAPRPFEIIHAQAKDQDKNLLGRPQEGRSEIAAIE